MIMMLVQLIMLMIVMLILLMLNADDYSDDYANDYLILVMLLLLILVLMLWMLLIPMHMLIVQQTDSDKESLCILFTQCSDVEFLMAVKMQMLLMIISISK